MKRGRQGDGRLFWPLVWLGGVLLAGALVVLTMKSSAERQLHADAEHLALQYAHFLAGSTPGLPQLLAGQAPRPDTLAQLRRLRQVGDVFRFKLFSPEGIQLLVSDDLDKPDAQVVQRGSSLAEHQRNNPVQALVLGGRPFIELKDGAGKPDRPPVYSEAYVPVQQGGKVLGVVEVYVDQTARRASIRAALLRNALALGAALLLLSLLGGWHWRQRLRAQQRVEERLHYMARHDALSGALNRESFLQALQQARLRFETGHGKFAVLSLNLDHFKDVNAALGHAAGDALLKAVTMRLREVVRSGDLIARLGGDEFAILQHDVENTAAVERLAARVLQAMGPPFELDGQSRPVGMSIGAAVYGIDAQDLSALLERAELALQRAKSGRHQGGGGFSFYDAALDQQLQDRRALARELREAIAAETLHLHYQPLYDRDGRTLVGYETLLRWQHPRRGAIGPAEFVPLAEDHGLIEALGRWVLRRACRDAASWPATLSVAINLSPAQFRDARLVDTVMAALQEADLAPERLELEITERLLMTNTEAVVATLKALSALGVRIAMDDFGTGYSSLAYLWRFPFDKLKIDRAFTQALTDDVKANLVVRSIVSLAHSLEIRVNAEGVETAEQMQVLQKHGCDELQGFLFGRPAAPEALDHAHAAEHLPGPMPIDQAARADLPTMPAPFQ
jgi:diguanylate cyclase (GGDEF)-like protein